MNKIKKIVEINTFPDYVSIATEQFVKIDGEEVKLDIPRHRVSYNNSISDRERLQKEMPENVVRATFEIWGDNPTKDDLNPRISKLKTELPDENV